MARSIAAATMRLMATATALRSPIVARPLLSYPPVTLLRRTPTLLFSSRSQSQTTPPKSDGLRFENGHDEEDEDEDEFDSDVEFDEDLDESDFDDVDGFDFDDEK